MMAACPPRERLEQFVGDQLGAAERIEVESHLKLCHLCQEAVAALSNEAATKAYVSAKSGAPEPDELPPELRQHPRYRILELLGAGGMGAVYKAEHRLMERPVVLKVIRRDMIDRPDVIERFRRETKAVARLSHPNVVTVFEAEQVGDTHLLAMEFIEGIDLLHLVKGRGVLPVTVACELVRQAAVGLQHVHERGLVHRDIKPSNLMLTRTGLVKLLDLGLAKVKTDVGAAMRGDITRNQFVGTVDYSAPEQWDSGLEVDIRADIYSLGCTLYSLLCGTPPFDSTRYSSVMRQMWAHSNAPVPPIADTRSDVPPELEAILNRMLAKIRDDRFATPGEVAIALEPFAAGANLMRLTGQTGTTTQRIGGSSAIGPQSAVPATGQSGLTSCQLAAASGTIPRAAVLQESSPLGQTVSQAATETVSPQAVPVSAPTRRRPWLAIGIGVAAVVVATLGLMIFQNRDRSDRNNASSNDPNGGKGTEPAYATSGPPIKVGVLHSRTGFMAISERSVIDATLLAIEELNEQGGLLGRRVEPVVEDGASDWSTFKEKAEKLITEDKVCTVFGCWTSASRKTVRPVFESHDHLLFYPVQYEGLEQSPNIVYTGAAPNQQIIPAVKWLALQKKKTLFLVGSDYVFPRSANEIIKDQAKELGVEIVGEEYVLLNNPDVAPVVRKIVEANPDAILNTINGDGNVTFFRTLRAAGITPDKIPTVSFSISEEELSSLSLKDIAGDYAAWNYFQSLNRPQNKAFVKRFQAKYGPQRVTTDPMEAAWFGVQLWAQAVREAKSDNVQAIRQAIKEQSLDAPEGRVRIDPQTLHTWKTVRIGRISEQGQFEIIYDSDTSIQPIPYPASRSPSAWGEFLQDMHLRWGGWSNPGLK